MQEIIRMKHSQSILALAAAGVIGLASVAHAEESQVQTALASTTLSGYVDTSAIWKFGSGNNFPGTPGGTPGGRFPSRQFDGTDKQDGFNLNVVKLSLEKALDETDWAAGYKVDLLFGPDANGYNPVVANNTPITPNSELGIKQAYIALRAPIANDVYFKVGTWDTIIGYEVFESGDNWNYSRSYGYTLEPFQHTGILASYQLTEVIGLAAGVANTLQTGINRRSVRTGTAAPVEHNESHKSYMGSVTITAPKSAGFLAGSTLVGGVVDGFGGGGTSEDWINWYVGGTLATPWDNLVVGASYDYVNVPVPGTDRHANATSLYLRYKASDKLRFNNRAEYARGSNGTWWMVGPGTMAGGDTGDKNEVFANTFTVEYSLWANVMTRAEFRWDRALNGTRPFGSADRNALSLAANVIYKF
jgi:hypothetical protein